MACDEGYKDGQVAEELKKANGDAPHQEGNAEAVTPESTISTVGFSDSTVTILDADGFETLSDILFRTEDEMLAVEGITKARLGHIRTQVKKLGFAFRSAEATPAEQAEKEMIQDATPAPKHVAEWKVYCRAWLKTEATHQAIRKRWNDERGLRNGCGVTSEDRDPIQAEMVARCKELGE